VILQVPSHLAKHTVTISEENLILLADVHFVQRALENLLINIGRYAKNQLKLNFSHDDNYTMLTVEDDGPGIATKVRDKIFDAV
jgi:two-component system OmpR family sensor kinase